MNKITIHADKKYWPDIPSAVCGTDTKSSTHRVIPRGAFKDHKCTEWEVKCEDCERLTT